jgi:hypothetical protein
MVLCGTLYCTYGTVLHVRTYFEGYKRRARDLYDIPKSERGEGKGRVRGGKGKSEGRERKE